ncbi:hypothetical protein GA0070616_3733 [Micromonospora nigra]|uniref:Phosphotransferase enzyme family protein n=1 Tax=Micromonospora nigra TaxID=145857 RepID=A0A1C6SGS2_9ACTN|nr:hypothetical protein [Micromonospora nigra]SCL28642.1 hypothetical protein GA0070616_3733 [Micromonospora nigra]
MPRRHWNELPDAVRREVERHTGRVHASYAIPTGASCDVAATLDTATGRVFCKGGEADAPTAWLYRNEARLNPWLPAVAPRLRWTVDCEGWLLLGFAYAAGRHPDLAPGSPDLAPLADLLGDLSRRLTPGPLVEVPRFTHRWGALIAPKLVDGDTLLHTDMTPRNFLLSEGQPGDVLLVDWSGPARGAAWIDSAFLLHRLIRAGHTPAAAEEWAARVPVYARAPEPAVTAFADALVRLWQRKQRNAPAPHHGPLLDAARRWAAYRQRFIGGAA